MATNFKRFNNGANFINFETVAKIEAVPFNGGYADVKFITITGEVFTINMNEAQFSALGLPAA
jgi:hypothetical protein